MNKKSKLYYMDEILHKISSMSQAENEKQLDDITPSILKSVGKYTAADRVYIFEWSSEKKEVLKIHLNGVPRESNRRYRICRKFPSA
mgnify:FL=1